MTQPDILTIPFGENAAPETINPIPTVRQPSDDPQQATWSEGFPRITMQPLVTGGIPPKGQDFNGILKSISEHIVFQNSGGQYRWSDDWVSQKGGYSLGDVIQSDDGSGSYVSLVNNNTDNFNTDAGYIGSSWLPWSGQGAAGIRGMVGYSTAGVFTFQVPKGVNKVMVEVIGGGGGGGRVNDRSGGGGGGGGVSRKLCDLTGVSSVTVTVGSGGAGGSSATPAGGSGGASSFGSFCSASGGAGATVAGSGGQGGIGSGGDFNSSTGSGGAAAASPDSAGQLSSGAGGGAGGRGSVSQNPAAGMPALGAGGGGSGSVLTQDGAKGFSGSVVIFW